MGKVIAVIVGVILVVGVVVGIMLTKNKNDNVAPAASSSQTATPAETPAPVDNATVKSGQVSVAISGFAFSPATLKVKKGATVTWTNNDSTAHTVTSDPSSDQSGLDSGSLDHGATYKFTFKTVGMYTYHCTFHPDMTASVEVVN